MALERRRAGAARMGGFLGIAGVTIGLAMIVIAVVRE
jgi:hypothetical protein